MTNKHQLYLQDYFKILIVKAQKTANSVPVSPEIGFLYFDLFSLAKQQAAAFDIPLSDLGLQDFDEWKYLQQFSSKPPQ